MSVYGYCRISTAKQNLERQERNILRIYPEAIIIKEVYTGTCFVGRRQFELLLKKIITGDTIVFDSVSRMSRTAEEGYELYKKLFEAGICLEFLKEPQINTETYQQALKRQMKTTDLKCCDPAERELLRAITEALNHYILALAQRQIRLAFEQAEKEVTDLHKRTREGMETARLNGKQIGRTRGSKVITKKAVAAKRLIEKHAKVFGGTLSDAEVQRLAGISRNTYYRYKHELVAEQKGEGGLL